MIFILLRSSSIEVQHKSDKHFCFFFSQKMFAVFYPLSWNISLFSFNELVRMNWRNDSFRKNNEYFVKDSKRTLKIERSEDLMNWKEIEYSVLKIWFRWKKPKDVFLFSFSHNHKASTNGNNITEDEWMFCIGLVSI